VGNIFKNRFSQATGNLEEKLKRQGLAWVSKGSVCS